MIELHYFNDGALLVKSTDENQHEYLILLTHAEARQLHQELSQDFISPDHYYNPDDIINLDDQDTGEIIDTDELIIDNDTPIILKESLN